jgi:hypothetical protein
MSGAWSIKDSINNVPPEGNWLLRFEGIEVGTSKEGNDTLKFKLKITDDDEEWGGKNVFVTRSLLRRAIGILGSDLTNTEMFTGEDDILPSDPEELKDVLVQKLMDRVFIWECKHGEYQGRQTGNWRLVGPSTAF